MGTANRYPLRFLSEQFSRRFLSDPRHPLRDILQSVFTGWNTIHKAGFNVGIYKVRSLVCVNLANLDFSDFCAFDFFVVLHFHYVESIAERQKKAREKNAFCKLFCLTSCAVGMGIATPFFEKI